MIKKDIKSSLVKGSKWTLFSKLLVVFFGIIRISILSRFLEPEDFGLMALITFFLGLTDLLLDVGISTAILFKQDISKKVYSSLYWLNILLSIIIYLIVLILAKPISFFYNQSELLSLLPLMGFSIIFSALGRHFFVIEQKKLNLKFISIQEVFSAILGLFISIILSYKGYGIYALVFGSLCTYLISNIILFFVGIRNNGLLLHFNFNETRFFLRIGLFQLGGQIINYFTRDFDLLLIGKFFGVESLGLYNLAKDLVKKPILIFDPVVNRLSVSFLPRYQKKLFMLRRLFSVLLKLCGSINTFIYGSIFICSPYLVTFFYGDKFLTIVPYVQLFSLLMYFRSMGSLVGIMIVTVGKTYLDFYWNFVISLIYPIAIIIGKNYSLNMVIVSMIIVQLTLFIPSFIIFYKNTISLKFSEYFRLNFIPLLLAFPFVFPSIYLGNFTLIRVLLCILLFLCLSTYILMNNNNLKNMIKNYKKNLFQM